MLVSKDEIEHYIPQRSPIVMVHELMEASEEYAVTHFHITADHVFVQHGVLLEPGMVENIAQTAATQVGYIFKRKNVPIPIGYIAGIKDLEILDQPQVGTTIKTTVRVLNQVLDVTLVEGTIHQNEKLMARCEMRIFVRK
jgi:3-hydroxyacyl-[acyl-carrier-protein] dehydratase